MANNPFWRRGISRFYWVPTIANLDAPTAAEITAGTRLDSVLTGVDGFTFSASTIAAPTLDTTFDKKVGGPQQVPDSKLHFLENKPPTSNPLQTTLVQNTTGFIVIFWGGCAGAVPAVADKCEVWPEQSLGWARGEWMSQNAATWVCDFTAPDTPHQLAAVA